MSKGYLLVEGYGEIEASQNLVTRLWDDLGLTPQVSWKRPWRVPGIANKKKLLDTCRKLAFRQDCERVLILRDEDDDCPRDTAPEIAKWLKEANLPFPVAVVLFYREYEVLFLPCVPLMVGKPLINHMGVEHDGLISETVFKGNPEDIRGVKGWLSRHFPPNTIYKPTMDQLPMTRMIDFAVLRSATPPVHSFGSLERALQFLASATKPGEVYPIV